MQPFEAMTTMSMKPVDGGVVGGMVPAAVPPLQWDDQYGEEGPSTVRLAVDAMPPSVASASSDAMRWNDVAAAHADDGQDDEAISGYLEATRCSPGWHVPWLNLGALYKRARDWEQSLHCCLRALQLDPACRGEWNIGIAATALGDWSRARWAWRRFFEVPGDPGDDGPIVGMQLAPAFVRVNPVDAPYVLWCTRLDPARTVVEQIPPPSSKRRYRDVLLNDGIRQGEQLDRQSWNRTVYQELVRLTASPYITWSASVEAPSEGDMNALHAMCAGLDLVVEDWTLRHLFVDCISCREARSHEHERAQRCTIWQVRRSLAFAARTREAIIEVLAAWAAPGGGRVYEAPREEF